MFAFFGPVMLVVATCYQPVEGQTDSTPDITADGSRINLENPLEHRWIAVSRDLLNVFNYGDVVFVEGSGVYNGYWQVHDTMNKRFKKRIDFLVGREDYLDKWNNVKVSKVENLPYRHNQKYLW